MSDTQTNENNNDIPSGPISPNAQAFIEKFSIAELNAKTITELYNIAKDLNIQGYRKIRKQDLIFNIMAAQAQNAGLTLRKGMLDILPEGFGFLRVTGYFPSQEDIYISQSQIRRFGLWQGDMITGQVRPPKDTEKYQSIAKVEAVNDLPVDKIYNRTYFDDLTPVFPYEKIDLEISAAQYSGRMINMFSPIGKGQRGLIVAQPKVGKTTLLKEIANSISKNHPEIYIMALLIDERPEEVTDMQRSIQGEVAASTFDKHPENHIRLAEMVLERAKRLVEIGKDVVILLDSITRLARAYNLVTPPSGRTLSGGFDPGALHRPKRFFGAARKPEEGGSLTILATALIETGSKMDDVIYEEFKGTGNMELVLDRKLADKRIFPAIDIQKSGTRREDLLLGKDEVKAIITLRKTLDSGDTSEVTQFLIKGMGNTKDNNEFLASFKLSE